MLRQGLTHQSHVKTLADDVIAAISAPFRYGGERLEIGASVGFALCLPTDKRSADEWLHHADLALYESKRSGRGRALPGTQEMLDRHFQFQEMSKDIRRGVKNLELVAHLQPQVHGASGALIGFEALARWNHPKRGLLTLCHCMATAKRAGLMPALDQEVRESALATLSMWDRQGLVFQK